MLGLGFEQERQQPQGAERLHIGRIARRLQGCALGAPKQLLDALHGVTGDGPFVGQVVLIVASDGCAGWPVPIQPAPGSSSRGVSVASSVPPQS
jgi:hypothetical protein